MNGITVAVPVGPQQEYKQYLGECLDSVSEQMTDKDQIIIVDDQAHLEARHIPENLDFCVETNPEQVRDGQYVIWRTSWLVGCADAWNAAVSMAGNSLVLLLGSDDRLYPDCLDELRDAYTAHNYLDAWYNLTVEITEGPDKGIHDVFNNAAAVTKGLWNLLGGFPPSAGAGAPDALLISVMLVHMPERLIQVKEGTPLYWARVHDAQETPRQAGFFNWEVIQIRNKETQRWQKPTWT